jgi:minor extracellular serine protease Vpr
LRERWRGTAFFSQGVCVVRGFILILTLISALSAQVVPGRFIVELTEEPVFTAKRSATNRQSAAKERREARAERLSAIRAQRGRVRGNVERAGSRVTHELELVANALVVEGGDRASLAKLPGVKAVHPVIRYKVMLDRAVGLQRVPEAWSAIGGQGNAGAGVRIGIIDTGIDPSHPGFQDSSLPSLDGFPRVNASTDLNLSNRKVIVARNYGDGLSAGSARDVDGHGSAVAMIAAGTTNTGPRGDITGIAPKAYLGNYKVFPDDEEGAPLDGIIRAIEDAVADGMDVINLSLGVDLAERPETDILVMAVERATQAGAVVVIAAGNSGPDLNTIGSPGTAPSAITVGNSLNDRVFAASVRVPSANASFVAQIGTGPRPGTLSAPLGDVAQVDPTGLACGSLPAGSLRGRIALIARGTCTFEEKFDFVATAGAIGAIVFTDDRPVITMDQGSSALPAMMVTNADGLAMKAYQGVEVTLVYTTTAVSVNSNQLANSTSKGPAPAGAIKPDVLAVGSSIYTAGVGSLGSGYTVLSGTSLSAPMVTGAAALVRGARRNLTAEQIKSVLVNSTSQFAEGSFGIQQTGSGLLDVAAALRSTVSIAPVSLNFGIGGSTVEQTRTLQITNLSDQPDTLSLTPLSTSGLTPNVSASTLALGPGETASVNVVLQGANTGQSQGWVEIRSNLSDVVSRVSYWYATPGTTAKSITIFEGVPTSARRNGTVQVAFRVTDDSGVALSERPQIKVVEGNGRVQSLESLDSQYPGVWGAVLQLGAVPGVNTFEIAAPGGKTTQVSVTGR